MAKEDGGYPATKEPGLKKGGSKDAAAYSEKASAPASAPRKGAKLDSAGGCSGKDGAQYKKGC